MRYNRSACANWDELIKNNFPNKINKILPTYLAYAR